MDLRPTSPRASGAQVQASERARGCHERTEGIAKCGAVGCSLVGLIVGGAMKAVVDCKLSYGRVSCQTPKEHRHPWVRLLRQVQGQAADHGVVAQNWAQVQLKQKVAIEIEACQHSAPSKQALHCLPSCWIGALLNAQARNSVRRVQENCGQGLCCCCVQRAQVSVIWQVQVTK